MRPYIKLIGYIGILATIIPAILFLSGKMELESVKTIMLAATIVWFAASIIQAWDLDKKFLVKADK